MDEIAKQTTEERSSLFEESANRRGVALQIIEKDFWVCWTLKRLFELPNISSHLIFKGGTSLSKVYGVIQRFSEDIDVSINREYLGFRGSADPINLPSKNKQRSAVEAIKLACKEKVQSQLLNELGDVFAGQLGPNDWILSIDESDPDGQTILFQYPKISDIPESRGLKYVRPIIRIELGARAEHQPAEIHQIRPYVTEDFPELYPNPEFTIKVLAATRTFWEKATILHDQYHRSKDDKTSERVSRHYYDLFQMAQTDIAGEAIPNLELLQNVVENKKLFFPRAGANYDEALTGNLHLSPHEDRLQPLRLDYQQMNEMFFTDPPDFDVILSTLAELERKINSQFL